MDSPVAGALESVRNLIRPEREPRQEAVLGTQGPDEYSGEMVVDGGAAASSSSGRNSPQEDIASRVGASREMVSKILQYLASGRYLSTTQRRITRSNSRSRRRGTTMTPRGTPKLVAPGQSQVTVLPQPPVEEVREGAR